MVIVGAGPAGLSAAAELGARGIRGVVVLEREPVAGGVPRHCGHSPFGLREFRRPMFGPAYARALAARAVAAGARLFTRVTVTALLPGPRLQLSTPDGTGEIAARAVLLATGARESSRAERLIGGTRPAGVLTTGALQALVYGAGQRPFRRPVILGTELVSFSAVLTCRHGGIRPVAMVEPGSRITARAPAALLPRLLGIALLTGTDVEAVLGRDRVEAVALRGPGGARSLPADGLVVTGRFRPEASLVRASHLVHDRATGGPEIDECGRCSDPAFFAAGNGLRPVETAGWCWAEGRAVARAIAADLRGGGPARTAERIAVAGDAIRYVLPQRVGAGGETAFRHFQLRLGRPFRGTLTVTAGGRVVARRRVDSLPERRLLLPVPDRAGATVIAAEEAGP
ncbi:MAG: pyridine nucleotide-disulfide oxidoreductase [Alphaproteobacteria bacterium]|nr:MAG: pyridine nucleotide-disulfide oxidoreductase [Alphaproteobacteria bacterium]